jgi:hypothetical protein
MKELSNLVLIFTLLAVAAHFLVHAATPQVQPTAARNRETYYVRNDLQQWLS